MRMLVALVMTLFVCWNKKQGKVKGGGGTENKIVHSIVVVFNFSFLEIVELQIKTMYAVCACVCVYVCVCVCM